MKNISKSYNLLLLFAILLAVIGIISPFIPKIFLDKHQLSDLALIGDWWGGTSAVFLAMAGIILLILNYLSQREELELTRQELTETRNEFIEQNQTLKIEKFENTLFNLLKHRNIIIDSLVLNINSLSFPPQISNPDELYQKGRNCFKYFVDELHSIYPDPKPEFEFNYELKLAKAVYNSFSEKYTSLLNHYFRYNKFIIKFIDNTDFLNEREKQLYVEILVYQISNPELVIFFYMGLSEYGECQGYKELFEKFKVFKNVYLNAAFRIEHKAFYEHLESEE